MAALQDHFGDVVWEGECRRLTRAWFGYRALARADQARLHLLQITVAPEVAALPPDTQLLFPPTLFREAVLHRVGMIHDCRFVGLREGESETGDFSHWATALRTGANSLSIQLAHPSETPLEDAIRNNPAQIDWLRE